MSEQLVYVIFEEDSTYHSHQNGQYAPWIEWHGTYHVLAYSLTPIQRKTGAREIYTSVPLDADVKALFEQLHTLNGIIQSGNYDYEEHWMTRDQVSHEIAYLLAERYVPNGAVRS